MTRILGFTLLILLLGSPAFADKADKKRAKIQKTRADVLEQLYEERPATRQEIKNAAGYAVFSNIGVNVIFISAGGGSGVVHDNDSGKDTYMKMGSAGVGIGWGIKDFRGIFIFHTRRALDTFIKSGDSSCTLYADGFLHPVGRWYHAAMVYENGAMRHYVDGQEEVNGHLDMKPPGAGQTSIGVRQNKVCWFKGAVAATRFTPRVLEVDEFLRATE